MSPCSNFCSHELPWSCVRSYRRLVECPCQGRNAAGVAVALTAAELSLSGIKQLIPFDEMLQTMYQVGRQIPPGLRETALGAALPPLPEKAGL